jgi:DNA-binding response OmpR family regulator
VFLGGEEIVLTPRDLSVLMFLADHPNQTFTRDQLIDQVWGWEYEGSDRAVDLAIKRLRKALKEWDEAEGEIKTLRGLGYQLSVPKK